MISHVRVCGRRALVSVTRDSLAQSGYRAGAHPHDAPRPRPPHRGRLPSRRQTLEYNLDGRAVFRGCCRLARSANLGGDHS